jgi:NAD(P)-dependent dehydrogenase (short-subunit alcohol dehydrogenase family)
MSAPVVVITGVGRRGQTGEAVAAAFAERGWKSVLIDRSEDDARARSEELRAAGGESDAFGADLTRIEEIARVTESLASAATDNIRALVCLAGGYLPSGRVDLVDPSTYEKLLAINLTTAFLTTRAFLPALRATRGSIVYFGSDAALPGGRAGGNSAYVAAKAGVIALMRAVAQDERESGVRANALAPTQIRTAANLESMGSGARYVEREEIAETVFWLCSPEAAAVSGEVIRLA